MRVEETVTKKFKSRKVTKSTQKLFHTKTR